VEFDGERIDIRAGIETVAGYSAHADQRGLLSFVTGMRRWPSEIRVVHGDAEARSALVDVLQSRYSARGLPVRILGGSA
jgi:metallo-beta-lactamase family protein